MAADSGVNFGASALFLAAHFWFVWASNGISYYEAYQELERVANSVPPILHE
jgi:hypothetical protein